jgi:hypothetical protein
MIKTIRILLFLFVAGLLLVAACTAKQPEKTPSAETPKPPPMKPSTSISANPDIARAQDLLSKNDAKGAIKILENIAMAQHPMSEDLKSALIDAHDNYCAQLSVMRNIPKEQMDIFIEVMYMHAARILELKPDHPGAMAQKQSVMTYYKEHQKTPPAMIDPMMFLDDRLSQAGASSPTAPK